MQTPQAAACHAGREQPHGAFIASRLLLLTHQYQLDQAPDARRHC